MRSPAIVVLVASLVACKRPASPTVHPLPLASVALVDAGARAEDVAPAVATEAHEERPSRPWAASWNDPAAIDALARDCDFHPPERGGGPGSEPDPLSCATTVYEQSCTFDPCHDGDFSPCRARCVDTCSGCDALCRTSCRACCDACHDPDCVRACATSCGRCIQGCIDESDRCVTAGCTTRYEACALRSAVAFRRGPCLAACGRCQRACEDDDDTMACVERCLGRGRACTADQRQHCAWNGADYGEETLRRLGDAGVGGIPSRP